MRFSVVSFCFVYLQSDAIVVLLQCVCSLFNEAFAVQFEVCCLVGLNVEAKLVLS